jgi:hypothetical protein
MMAKCLKLKGQYQYVQFCALYFHPKIVVLTTDAAILGIKMVSCE